MQRSEDSPKEVPLTEEEAGFLTARDEEDNRTTTPPVGERVRLPALWVIEAFTPATIANLEEGAHRLGWEADGQLINRDFLAQVGQLRTSARAAGWLNLGLVGPEGRATSWRVDRTAPLPEGVNSVRPTIFQPFPSITLLCCQFELDENLAECLHAPLHEKFSTRKEQVGESRYMYLQVEHLKERQVDVARATTRSICTEWLAEYFPGYFSANSGTRGARTFELMLFSLHDDFAFASRREEPAYLRVLGCQNSGENWRCLDADGLYMTLAEKGDASHGGTLFGNVHKILKGKESLGGYGQDEESQVVNWLGSYLDRSLATLALNSLADSVIAQLGRARDELSGIGIAADSTVLWAFEERIAMLERTTLPLTTDLKAYCRREALFLHDLLEFEQEITFRDLKFKLFADLRGAMRTKAAVIDEMGKHLQAVTSQAGRILAARTSERVAQTNINLQRWMLWLTIAIGAFTVVSAIDPLKKLLE